MCICFCCCNCCNSYTSKCVEISILTLSSITFICSVSKIIIIKFSHLNMPCLILLIISILFSLIMILLSIFITIFRKKGIINSNKNSMSICFVYIGLFMSLIIFITSIVSESLIQAHFNEINHPCKNYSYDTPIKDNNGIYFRILSTDEFCKNKEKNYNAKICSDYEYTLSYLTASFIEFSCIILSFLWFNDSKRIKGRIDGAMILNRVDFNAMQKRQSMYRGQIDPIDNYFSRNNQNYNQSSSYQSQAVMANNQKKIRRNSAFNLNFSKNSGRVNFISNLRKDMKNGMDIIEEVETKKESKDNKENNDNKTKNHKKRRFSVLRRSKNEDNNQKNNDLKNDNNIIINNNVNSNGNKDDNNEDMKKNKRRKSRFSIFKKRSKAKSRKSKIEVLDIYNAKNNMEKEEKDKKNNLNDIKEENDEDIIDPPDIISPK